MFKKPKNYTNKISIYTSKFILDRCDLKNEWKRLKNEGRLKDCHTFVVFRMHMGLIINFLTYSINDSYITGINRKKLQQVSTSELYRPCIEILKKHKIIFICGKDVDHESYEVGKYSKSYKFNLKMYQLTNDTYVKIDIVGTKMKKKVSLRIADLQVSKHLLHLFGKKEFKFNYVVQTPIKNISNGIKGIRDIFFNETLYDKAESVVMFHPQSALDGKERSNKWFIIRRIKEVTGYSAYVNDMYMISIKQLQELRRKLGDIGKNAIRFANEKDNIMKEYGLNTLKMCFS
jgi:hypothetical protein